jgi:hypothetical protein
MLYVASEKHIDIFYKMLVQYPVDIYSSNYDVQLNTILMYTCINKWFEATLYILSIEERPELFFTNKTGKTALMLISETNDFDIIIRAFNKINIREMIYEKECFINYEKCIDFLKKKKDKKILIFLEDLELKVKEYLKIKHQQDKIEHEKICKEFEALNKSKKNNKSKKSKSKKSKLIIESNTESNTETHTNINIQSNSDEDIDSSDELLNSSFAKNIPETKQIGPKTIAEPVKVIENKQLISKNVVEPVKVIETKPVSPKIIVEPVKVIETKPVISKNVVEPVKVVEPKPVISKNVVEPVKVIETKPVILKTVVETKPVISKNVVEPVKVIETKPVILKTVVETKPVSPKNIAEPVKVVETKLVSPKNIAEPVKVVETKPVLYKPPKPIQVSKINTESKQVQVQIPSPVSIVSDIHSPTSNNQPIPGHVKILPRPLTNTKQEYKPAIKQEYKPAIKQEYKPAIKQEYKPVIKEEYKPDVKPTYIPGVKRNYKSVVVNKEYIEFCWDATRDDLEYLKQMEKSVLSYLDIY